MKKRVLTALALVASGSMAFAANPVTVASSGGDFTTIQAAIASFASGGTNAGETPPFVINVDPADNPYDEAIDLDDANAGSGDIQGDLVIQSSTPGTRVELALQLAPTGGANDGIMIHQDTASVSFTDILFYPSLTNPFSDEMIKIDKNTDDPTNVTHEFTNCIVTEILDDGSGNPLITTKLDAAQPAPATVGSGRSGFAYAVQKWGDNDEAISLTMTNSAVYGNLPNASFRLASTNTTDVVTLDNTIVGGGGSHLVRQGSGNDAGSLVITGTDQTEGPANAAVLAYPGADDHCLWFSGSEPGQTAVIDSAIFYDVAGGDSRGISGSASVDLTVSDAIIHTPGPNVVDGPENASTYDRVTFHTTDDNNAFFLVAGAGSITVRDSIFSGVGTKLSGTTPTGGFDVDFSSFVASGPDAITAQDDGSITITYGSNIITADPQYVSKSLTSADLFDVDDATYGGAGTASSDLAGGADYVATNVRDWVSY